MKIVVTKNYQELSKKIAEIVISKVKAKPDLILGLPTGQTPLGMYEDLINANQAKKISFAKVKTFNLDEYVGLGPDDQDSYYSYMYGNFFVHIDIKSRNVHILNGLADNLEAECARYEQEIEQAGGIDVMILGIGTNGHIAFCEPGTSFDSLTHLVDLSDSTRNDNSKHLVEQAETPKQALTMGLKTIMNSKEIILLASGEHKKEIMNKALHGPVNEEVPASILQNHKNVTVIMDEAAKE